ncbi:MAG: hypothetical protein AAF684_08850, partial [Pseudomonadota bacterium]
MIAAKTIGGGAVVALILFGGVLMFGFLTRGPIVHQLQPVDPGYSFSIVRSAKDWTLPVTVRGLPAAEAAAALSAQKRGIRIRFDPTLDPR